MSTYRSSKLSMSRAPGRSPKGTACINCRCVPCLRYTDIHSCYQQAEKDCKHSSESLIIAHVLPSVVMGRDPYAGRVALRYLAPAGTPMAEHLLISFCEKKSPFWKIDFENSNIPTILRGHWLCIRLAVLLPGNPIHL